MVQRRYKIRNRFKELEKFLKNSVLSGKAKKLIEIGGKPTKLPKKIRKGVEESYRPFPKNLNRRPKEPLTSPCG